MLQTEQWQDAAAGAVRAAGGISTSRESVSLCGVRGGVSGDLRGSIYGHVNVVARSFVTMLRTFYAVAIIGSTSAIVSAPASPAIPSACPSMVLPVVVAMVTVACMPTVAGVGIIGFGAGMSLAASDISDSGWCRVWRALRVCRAHQMLRSRYCVYFVLMNSLIGGWLAVPPTSEESPESAE